MRRRVPRLCLLALAIVGRGLGCLGVAEGALPRSLRYTFVDVDRLVFFREAVAGATRVLATLGDALRFAQLAAVAEESAAHREGENKDGDEHSAEQCAPVGATIRGRVQHDS